MPERASLTNISITTGTMVRAVVVLICMVLLWALRDLVLIILTAIIIASFVELATPHFQRLKINRVFGIFCLYAITILILVGLFYLFAPLLITELYSFSSAVSSYVPGVYFLNYFQNDAFSGAKDIVDNLSTHLSFSTLTSVSKAFIQNLSGGFLNTVSVAFGGIFNVGMIILISFYLSIQEKGIENFLRIITPMKKEDYIIDLWDRSSHKIALWVKGQLLLGLVIAVLTYLVLSLIGIQYALVLAMIAGIMELVPYGILIAVIPAIAFSYLSGGIGQSLMVAGAYLIIHQFEVFLFAPLIIKKIVGLSPIVIILAALIGFELASFWGVVLAIPLAILVIEYSDDIEKSKLLARTKHEK
jgi:predicted PurR-regulated permease PerM